ncbi:MAG: hypothetical protein WD691_02105 [Acidimicrobiales bacterium]
MPPLPRWLLPGVSAAVVLPLAVAVLAQRNAHWHPVYDLAMTEIRVRDVGGRHTPLIGLQGRIGPTGSHPGPLSFYLLAPIYRLLGSSAFALQAATGVLQAAGAVTALAVAHRRGSTRVLLGVAIIVLLLMTGYGLGPLTEPWNPHLPLLWFVAFLVAAWAVMAGDHAMLIPAVCAASLCAQTHVPYLPVTVGVGVVIVVVAGVQIVRRSGTDGRDWRWVVAAAALGFVLWVPPLIDQVVHEPGNLAQIVDSLATPVDTAIGVRDGVDLMMERLDAWQLVVGETQHPGTFVRILSGPGPAQERGTATLVAWLICVGLALHLRDGRLLALHATVATATLVGAITISRIYGVPWYYLMLWGFGVGALMTLSIAATAALVLTQGVRRWSPAATTRAVTLFAAVLLVGLTTRLLVIAPDATTDTPEQTRQLGRLVGPTVAGLERDVGAATGHDGRYYVYWYDASFGGSEGIGLVNELIRRGYDVGVDAQAGVQISPYRVRDPRDSTARIVVASGGWISRIAAEPGATQVAADDPRSPAERAEFERLQAEAISLLEAEGRADLARRVETDLFDVALNGMVGPRVSPLLGRLLDIGVPVAVFVLPPGVST